MKHHRYGCIVVLFLLCSAISYAATGSSGTRMWDNATSVYVTSETIDSKLDGIDVDSDFLSTITTLESIEAKACSLSDSLSSIVSLVDSIDTSVQTNLSKVEIIYQKIEMANDTLDVIHIDDFGGTWTAIKGLENTFCSKFDVTIDNMATICSKVDDLSADNLEQFTATFTKLEELMDDVFNTMTSVEDFSNQIDNDLSSIDALIDDVSIQLITIESKVDNLSTVVTVGFDETFTVIEQVFETMCTVESRIVSLQTAINASFLDTSTMLDAFIENMCSIDSKVDNLNNSLSLIKGKVDVVDMTLD